MLKALLLTLSVCSAGDSGLTHYSLGLGARELNPLSKNPYVLDVARGTSVGLFWTFGKKLDRSSPKATRTALVLISGVECGAVASNVVQARRQVR